MFFQILLLVSLLDLLLSLPGLPHIVYELSMVINVLVPLFFAVAWSVVSLVSGLGLLIWYSVSQGLSISYAWFNNKRSAFYALIFFSTFALSASSDFHLKLVSDAADFLSSVNPSAKFGRFFHSQYFIYSTSFPALESLSHPTIEWAIASCSIFSSIYLHLSWKALHRKLEISKPTPVNLSSTPALSAALDTSPEDTSLAEESTLLKESDDGEYLVPTDLFIAAVDHLVGDNRHIARKYDEITEEKKQLSIYNDNLNQAQIEVSQKVDDLQSENEYLRRQIVLLSAENDGLRLLNNSLSDENVDLEWKNMTLSQDIHNLKSENDALSCKSARLDQECEKLDDECSLLDQKFDHFKEIMQEVIAVKNREYSNISADLVFVESDRDALVKRIASPVFQSNPPASPCMCPCPDHPPAVFTPSRSVLSNSAGNSTSVNGNTDFSSLASEISSETTLNSPPSPSPLGASKVKATSSGSPKALLFASLLDTVILSPNTAQSLESVFNGNGLGLRLTPPSIDAVLAIAETSPPLSNSPEHNLKSPDIFRTSTPPPKYQLKKRAARLALKDDTNVLNLR